MRHAVFGRKLGRDINARKALLNNLASSLLEKGEIKTTLAKAKFVRPYVEQLISSAKDAKRISNQRYLASALSSQAFSKLTGTFAVGFKNRSGGYTRIIKLNPRNGDAAPMAKIELLQVELPKAAQKGKEANTAIQAEPKPVQKDQKQTTKKVTKNEKH